MNTPDQDARAERMEALGRLAAGVAHDFNNVLTVILGYSELLVATLPDDDTARPIIHDIAQAAQRAGRLTRDLMLFSGSRPVRPQLVGISEQIMALSSTLRRRMPEQISLTVNAMDPSLRVLGDPEQLAHLLENLAAHACDAMRSGGTLCIEASRTHVVRPADMAASRPPAGEYVLIRVKDSGEGIDAAGRERLFEPFFPVNRTGTRAGLQLAVVFGIAKAWNGFVTAQSEVGQGSTIDVYLPYAHEDALERRFPEHSLEDSQAACD
jgi:two-component system cell cycle sensor histidine kinase/response regulator CckA